MKKPSYVRHTISRSAFHVSDFVHVLSLSGTAAAMLCGNEGSGRVSGRGGDGVVLRGSAGEEVAATSAGAAVQVAGAVPGVVAVTAAAVPAGRPWWRL